MKRIYFLLIFISFTSMLKAECTFSSTTNNNWNNPSNWSCNHVPTPSDDVVINNSNVVIDANAVCKSLTLDGPNTSIEDPTGTFTLTVNDLYWRGGTIQSNITVTNFGEVTTSSSPSKKLQDGKLTNNGTINILADIILDACSIENNSTINMELIARFLGTDYTTTPYSTTYGDKFYNNGALNFKNNGLALTELPIDFYNQNGGSINLFTPVGVQFTSAAKFYNGSSITVDNTVNLTPTLYFTSDKEAWFEGEYTINDLNISLGSYAQTPAVHFTGNPNASLTFNKRMNFNAGNIEIPIIITTGGVLKTNGTTQQLSAKITNYGNIEDFNTNGNMQFGTNAEVENKSTGEITNPNFGNSPNFIPILNNYGTIKLTNANAYSIYGTFYNDGIINFQTSSAIFLYNNAIFSSNATFTVGTGLQPALFFNKTLELQGSFNAKSVQVSFNAATALLSGAGNLTVERALRWNYGQVDCPIYVETNADAQLNNLGSTLKLHSSFYNHGKTTSYSANVDFNNGNFENLNEFQLVNTKLLNEAGSNATSNTFYNCGKMILFGSPSSQESQLFVNFTKCAASSITGSSPLNFGVTASVDYTVSPGMSPGILTINPSVAATATAVFDMEITGGYGTAGIADDADKLISAGNIELNGTLQLRLTNAEAGDYTIIDGTSLTGNFTSIQYSVNGGAFTTTKPSNVTISYNTVQGTVTVTISAVLPVELISFKGKNTEGGNLLTWQTALETNTSFFDIERSIDGQFFEKIGETKAQGKAATYNYTDRSPLSITAYYRLKINDLDKKSSYSNIVSINNGNKGMTTKVFPNPFGDNLNIEISTQKKTDITIELMDILGREVYQSNEKNTEGVFNLPISTKDLPSGTYFLKISDGQAVVQQKIVRQ